MDERNAWWLAVCAAALLPACTEALSDDLPSLATTSTTAPTSLPTDGADDGDPIATSTADTTADATSAAACEALADCPAYACQLPVACIGGDCFYENLPAGTEPAEQIAGDCRHATCDGHGVLDQRVDDDDLPADDGIDCTVDTCVDGHPQHSLRSEPCYTAAAHTRDIGVCVAGTRTCDTDLGDWGPCVGEITPTTEDCDPNNLDEDCDGMIDESGPSCGCGDGIVSTGEQCDDGNQSDADACTSDCEIQQVLEVAHGGRHACARLTGDRVKCWGDGDSGATGLGDTLDRGDAPYEMGQHLPDVQLDPARTPRALTSGYSHSCAVFSDGAVKCWGRNDTGQLGLGDKANRGDTPGEMGPNLPTVDLGVGQSAAAISADLGYTCAILTSGNVKCWGDNPFGQLGQGDTIDRGDNPGEMGNALPAVSLGAGVVALSTGTLHACALLTTGRIKCWGANFSGALGLGDNQSRGDNPGEMGGNLPPVDVGSPATSVSAGSSHTCALLTTGAVKCWGSNTYGQLGHGDTTARGDDPGEMGQALPAVKLGTGETTIALQSGADFNCALLASGGLKCWGRNHNGQLGLGISTHVGDQPGEMGDNLPTVDLGTGLDAMVLDAPASGAFITCARLTDGSLKCWGTGTYGSLGLGDVAHHGDQLSEVGDNLPRVRLFSSVW